MYQRINGSDWRNIWLMGDLHGCFALLMNRLRQLRFDPWADLLISVGDLIDRGPQSADCLGLLRCRWFRAVRGNHEQMALEALESGNMRLWQMNGGDWYVKGDARQRADVDRLLAHCRRLPLIIEVQCEKARHVIAHADYPAPVYRWQQPVDPQRVLWSRHRLVNTWRGAMALLAAQTISGLAIRRFRRVMTTIINTILIRALCLVGR